MPHLARSAVTSENGPAALHRRAVLSGGLAALALALVWPARAARAQQAAAVQKMAADAAHKAAQSGEIILIDIRRPEEWQQTGVAEGAIGLDMTQDRFVTDLVALRQANPDTPLAMICRTGNRTGYVTGELAARGFPGLVDVSEGMAGGRNGPGWLERGLPTYEGSRENVRRRTEAVLP